MATTGTLFSLAPQPLPKGDLVDSVFVTIWFFAVACFALILSWLLRIPYAGSVLNSLFERSRPALDVFRSICLATGILALLVPGWLICCPPNLVLLFANTRCAAAGTSS